MQEEFAGLVAQVESLPLGDFVRGGMLETRGWSTGCLSRC